MVIKGYVQKIKFSNEETGHAILEVSLTHDELSRLCEQYPEYKDDLEDEIVCVGPLFYISEGEYISFSGNPVYHATYGFQLSVVSYEQLPLSGAVAIEKYLGSGAIKGVGLTMAERIVRKFGEDTIRIIEEEPERLAEIKGISERIAMEIAEQVQTKREMRRAMMYLAGVGISMKLAVKIYKKYGDDLYEIVEKNPYRLADDIEGVGFKTADEIALNSGISRKSDFRIQSGILYILSCEVRNGNIFFPKDKLLVSAQEILGIEIENYEEILSELVINRKIVSVEKEDNSDIYLSALYHTELKVARALVELNVEFPGSGKNLEGRIHEIENAEGIELGEDQITAVKKAVSNGLFIMTGGPGTGKTTTIKTIISYFEQQNMKILLAAPTGRAAKRMTEATGRSAMTIHRLLEVNAISNDTTSGTGMIFNRNEDRPLEGDVIIIDEMSMVDIFLMNNLLKAIASGTRLILVGDADQLPSVGPGSVLRDIIQSERFEVVCLSKIYRQKEVGDIVVNAHKINKGEQFAIGTSSKDFPFIKRDDANRVIAATITLITDKLPKYTDSSVLDVQVLTPMKKGNLGAIRLNKILQESINPPSPKKTEKELEGVIYREGDKVMHIKNNYDLAWEIRGTRGVIIERGKGVFNGDMGIIENINLQLKFLTVRFDDGRICDYEFALLPELEHAYAITIHKSQGSEYPAVVLPLLDGPRMLMTRNILYTAVTRAKKCICVVGNETMFHEMIDNKYEQVRYTSLQDRIKEVSLSEF